MNVKLLSSFSLAKVCRWELYCGQPLNCELSPLYIAEECQFCSFLIYDVCKKKTWMKFMQETQGSKLAVAHGNQNVTWATWKRRKIAQLAIKNSSSPVSLNYRLYCDRFSVTCSTQMFLTQRNISYGFSNREPGCIVYRIILRLRNTLNFGKFPKFKTYQCGRKAYGRIRENAIFFYIL